MTHQFRKHYTREEARALLPQIRLWLGTLKQQTGLLEQYDKQIAPLLSSGADCGGELVNRIVRTLGDIKAVLREFESREIQIKEFGRGLIDFPAILGGKEVFLCWELDEDDIEYWHDLSTGYAGRE